jgi:hypothetical protein
MRARMRNLLESALCTKSTGVNGSSVRYAIRDGLSHILPMGYLACLLTSSPYWSTHQLCRVVLTMTFQLCKVVLIVTRRHTMW